MSDIVPLNKYRFWLIDLPHGYNKSLSNLIDHIESIIEANEECYGECVKFYIGKATILRKGKCFDLDKEKSWNTKYIHDHYLYTKEGPCHALLG